jgi:hypothetical protein
MELPTSHTSCQGQEICLHTVNTMHAGMITTFDPKLSLLTAQIHEIALTDSNKYSSPF